MVGFFGQMDADVGVARTSLPLLTLVQLLRLAPAQAVATLSSRARLLLSACACTRFCLDFLPSLWMPLWWDGDQSPGQYAWWGGAVLIHVGRGLGHLLVGQSLSSLGHPHKV